MPRQHRGRWSLTEQVSTPECYRSIRYINLSQKALQCCGDQNFSCAGRRSSSCVQSVGSCSAYPMKTISMLFRMGERPTLTYQPKVGPAHGFRGNVLAPLCVIIVGIGNAAVRDCVGDMNALCTHLTCQCLSELTNT